VFAIAYSLSPTPPRPRITTHRPQTTVQRVDPEPRTVETTPTSVELRTEPSGAEVYDPDGAQVGTTPCQLERPSGATPIQYRIRMSGYRERTFAVGRRTQDHVTLTLERETQRDPHHRRPHDTGQQTTATTTTTETPHDNIRPIDEGILNPFEDPPQPRRPQQPSPRAPQ
jgi:hypothetical protein